MKSQLAERRREDNPGQWKLHINSEQIEGGMCQIRDLRIDSILSAVKLPQLSSFAYSESCQIQIRKLIHFKADSELKICRFWYMTIV